MCELSTRTVSLSLSPLRSRGYSTYQQVAKLEPTMPFTAALNYSRTSIPKLRPWRQDVLQVRRLHRLKHPDRLG